MNIINEFFVSFILIKLYFKFKVCRKIKFPLLWKFYFSKWKFYFSADIWVYFTMLEFIFTLILDFTFYSIKTLEKVFLGRTALVILFVVFIALFCVKGLFLYILLALELFLLLYLFLGILFLRFYKS